MAEPTSINAAIDIANAALLKLGIKAINDSNGHLFGAYAIEQAGRIIARVLGASGEACRFGGDEFTAFLPDMERSKAMLVAAEDFLDEAESFASAQRRAGEREVSERITNKYAASKKAYEEARNAARKGLATAQ